MPPTLFQLHLTLSHLDLSFNKIREIDNCICDLHELQYLDLSYNMVMKWNMNVSKLKQLKYFSIKGNKTMKLGAEYKKQQALTATAAASNSTNAAAVDDYKVTMEDVETCLFSLPCLQQCKLEGTCVESLQEHLESQKKNNKYKRRGNSKQQLAEEGDSGASNSNGGSVSSWLYRQFKKIVK